MARANLKAGDKVIFTQQYLEFVEDKVSEKHFWFLNQVLEFDRFESGCAFVNLERGFKVVGEEDVIPYTQFDVNSLTF